MNRVALLLLPLLTACTSLTESAESHHSSQGVTDVRARVDNGDVSYTGRDWGDGFDVDIDSTAWGSDEQVVSQRLADNRWISEPNGSTLDIMGDSGSSSSSVSFRIWGPEALDLDLRAEGGTVHASNVVGDHILVAGAVYADQLKGDVEIEAGSGGVHAEIWPYEGGTVTIHAEGSVDLELPWGGDYDLQVWGDPEYPIDVADLGFSHVVANPGYFAGRRGPGTTRIDVYVAGGGFTLDVAQ